MAGVMRVPAGLFLGMDFLAASLSVPVLLFAAYYFGDEIDTLRHMVGKTQNFVFLSAAVVALIIGLRFVIQRRRSKKARAAD
jgi:membrane protein DedA with SNARE-associated domain